MTEAGRVSGVTGLLRGEMEACRAASGADEEAPVAATETGRAGFTTGAVLCSAGRASPAGFFTFTALSMSLRLFPWAASLLASAVVRHLSVAVLLQSKSEFIPAQPVSAQHSSAAPNNLYMDVSERMIYAAGKGVVRKAVRCYVLSGCLFGPLTTNGTTTINSSIGSPRKRSCWLRVSGKLYLSSSPAIISSRWRNRRG